MLKKSLLLALLALAACSGDAAREARQEASKAAETARIALQEHAAAAADSARAAATAAGESAATAAEGLAASRDAAGKQLAVAAQAARRFLVGSKDDLVTKLNEELATVDAKKAELDAKIATASDDVRSNVALFVAAVDAKRQLLAAKVDQLKSASGEGWEQLQPALENSLGSLEEALTSAGKRVQATLDAKKPSGPSANWHPLPPKQLFDVVSVIDGDTIHILRAGKKEKLRLLSVDTEEKLSNAPYSEEKPETLYGEETKLWAIDLFAGLADENGVSHVGLLFPGGNEENDVYGRLLCQVLLPDGTDFNLKLVKEGRSPYFTKYGYSEICHAAFEAAEAEARKLELGIWNPDCNKPAAAGEPWHKRDYASLLPWWHARAEAVEAFRQQRAANPDAVVATEDVPGLEAGVERCGLTGYLISVFGVIDRTFDEDDGSLTVLFRSNQGEPAVRAHLSAAVRPSYASLDLPHRMESGKQNYLFAVGELVRGPRGFDVDITDAHSLRLGAPDPEPPKK